MLSNPTRSPRKDRHIRWRRSYGAVLLAIYWLSDSEGLTCSATNAEIGREAGINPETAKRYLHEMEATRVITAFDPGEGTPRRTIVLMDHPGASRLVEDLLGSGRRPGLHTAEARGWLGPGDPTRHSRIR